MPHPGDYQQLGATFACNDNRNAGIMQGNVHIHVGETQKTGGAPDPCGSRLPLSSAIICLMQPQSQLYARFSSFSAGPR